MSFAKNDGHGTIMIGRRQLLRELLALPFSDWARFPSDDAETRLEFHLKSTSTYGHVMIRCQDAMDESPALFLGGKRVCGASLIYSRLVGNWTKKMVRDFTKTMKQGPNWQHAPGTDLYSVCIDGDDLRLMRYRSKTGNSHELTINGINITGDWKPLANHLVNQYYSPPYE